jgi:tetratricopeptide (TPR) repeat protein
MTRAPARLLAALQAVEQHQRDRAAAEARAAIAEAPRDGLVRLAAGVVLSAAGHHREGLEELARAEQMDDKLAPLAMETAFLRAAPLGWDAEALAIAERGARAKERAAQWHARALRIHAQRSDPEGALAHARALRDLVPASAAVSMELAGLFAAAGRDAEVAPAVQASLARELGSVSHHLEAARVLIEAGEIDEARRCLARAIELDTRGVPARVGLAQLDLWSGQVAACAAQVEQIRAIDAGSHAAARLEGAMALLAGRHEEAGRHLDAAVAGDARDGEALLLRAEASVRLGHLAAARKDVSAALLAPGFSLPGRILWMLLDLREQGHDVDRQRLEEVVDGLLELVPDAGPALASGKAAGVERVVEAALRALHGNRSITPTHVVDGRLHRLRTRTAPRHASRQALELVRIAPLSRVLAALDAVVERYPASGLPLAHRGELHLWCGATVASRRDFEAAIAIEPRTRFAYIGLTGVEILEGRLQEALEVSARGVATMRNTEGPAVPAYRGEALRRLGQTQAAIADLERSVQGNPTRLGAWANLGLARADAGDAAGTGAAFARITAHAPGLVSDAAREVGAGEEARATFDGQRAILEHCLVMMRGNRSSACVTYFTRDGQLRCAPQHMHAGNREGDARDLDRVRRLLRARLTGAA